MQQEHRECIELCYECAAACDICASSCLREDNVEMMKHCIQLDMQCAAIYGIGKRVLTKIMPPVRGYLQSLRRRVCKARSRPLPELRAGMQPMRRRLP